MSKFFCGFQPFKFHRYFMTKKFKFSVCIFPHPAHSNSFLHTHKLLRSIHFMPLSTHSDSHTKIGLCKKRRVKNCSYEAVLEMAWLFIALQIFLCPTHACTHIWEMWHNVINHFSCSIFFLMLLLEWILISRLLAHKHMHAYGNRVS